jgi:hypothetical protein
LHKTPPFPATLKTYKLAIIKRQETHVKQLTEKPGNAKSTKSRKAGRPSRGRKRSAAKPAKVPEGHGAASLRNAANALLGPASVLIVSTLIRKAIAGNTTGARILMELSGPQKALPETKKKKRSGRSWADLLASEPELDECMEKGPGGEGAITVLEDGTIKRDASKLLPSEPEWPDDDEPGEIWVDGRWERPAKPASPKA